MRREDKTIQARAKRLKLDVTITDDWIIPYDQTLFVSPGTAVPWDLVPAGMGFMERWDAAAPLWRYGVLAADVGTPADRKRTEKVVRDLRVPLYAPELLFVRQSEEARRLLEVWQEETLRSAQSDNRLAFLRALYQVKPLFCALPRGWLVENRIQRPGRPRRHGGRARRRTATPMVRVEVAPGRFVRCRPGEEEITKARYQPGPRRERKRR